MDFVRVAGAQLNLIVGDIEGNRDRIIDAMAWAEGVQADVLLLPELAITGYPPEDLLLREAFVGRNLAALDDIAARAESVLTVVGFVDRAKEVRAPVLDDAYERRLANAAALAIGGRVRGTYHKGLLPNYGVFDEDRYFVPGADCAKVWSLGGVAIGVSVCEDIWVEDGPPAEQAAAGARLLLNINASPYHRGKGGEREEMLSSRAAACGVPLVYVNLVGGQDELVFDGESMVFDRSGRLMYRAPQFAEQLFWLDVPVPARPAAATASILSDRPLLEGAPEPEPPGREPLIEEAEVYGALVTGLGDYVRKNGFSGVVIGLSGGIDSALTAAIAADALGPDQVWGVTMPSRFSSAGSVDDSRDLATRLGIRFDEIPIDEIFAAHLDALGPVFGGMEPDEAEENLQARVRGAILMALSNKFGGIVVATGNKSELAVGYATLYGDMAGGYAVLKDVFKSWVYRLAEWRNRDDEVIPRPIIDKPPSAELRPDQRDDDSLPPYEELDPILERYVEWDWSPSQIVAAGFDPTITRDVSRMVDRNEYKRRQSAPGVKITKKAFGKDRRLPITNRFRR
jgi:NAD+ synthase (glutamine-hydrolysing)